MNERLIELLREELYNRLQNRTGWHRYEVIKAFDEAVAAVALCLLDEDETDKEEGGAEYADDVPF